MSAKLATVVLLKIKEFWNKGYDVVSALHDVISKVLRVMRLKFGNSGNSMREVIIHSIS